MTAPDVDTLSTYGGGLADYAPVIDSATDRPAAGANQAYASTAMMSHTAIRCTTRFSPQGSGTPILAAAGAQYDAQWLRATATAPVLARTGTGTYTHTWPATVMDEIPATTASGQAVPGYNASGHNLNLRWGWGNCEPGASTRYDVCVSVTAPNVLTIKVYTAGTSTLVDPNDGTVFAIFAS